MQETTINNATALGVSVNIESLNESESDVYLNCAGNYYKGTLLSGFKKQVTTVTVEGLMVDKNNTSGPQSSLGALTTLAGQGAKTTLQVNTTDGSSVSFGQGEIKSLSMTEGAHVHETVYSLTFETEETELTEGEDKNDFLLLDPAQYQSIDESFGYSHSLQDKTWELSHDLSVLPNNQADYTTKKDYEAALAEESDGLVSLSQLQIGQNYIQNAMLSDQPPFPLSSKLEGILGKACAPESFGDSCEYVLNYSYRNSYDLICGGSSTSKTISLQVSGISGYSAVHDVDFTRDNAGIVTVTLNGTVNGVRQDTDEDGTITKSFYDYAEEGYAIETGAAPGRMESMFDEFKDGSDSALISSFISSSKTVKNKDREGTVDYSLVKTNDPQYQGTPTTTVSKSNSIDKAYENICNGTKVLVTTISQTVSVQGCGAATNAGGEFPRFEASQPQYDALYAAAPAEIEALYDGDRSEDLQRTNTSQAQSPYKGSRTFTITYDDSPERDSAMGYPNSAPGGCYSWKVDEDDIVAWDRVVEAQSQLGLQVQTKGRTKAEKNLTISMKEGTGVCDDPILTQMLTKTKDLINSETTDTCFIQELSWNINKTIGERAEFSATTKLIQD